MKKWLWRVVAVVLLVGLGYWGWRVWFPGPEQAIRKRLTELARTASFTGREGTLVKLANAQALTTFCTPDVEIILDVPGHSRQTISGHDELLQAAAAARSYSHAVKVELFDILVTVAPDKNSAVAELTVKANVPSERDFYVQELRFTLKQVEGKWLISRVESVKTLSP
jgi:hypothetical protein